MTTGAQRLAEAVKRRREQLDLSQMDVWNAGGPSNTTLTTIENGKVASLNRTTARKLDTGLRWQPGSAKAVWEGLGDPVPADEGGGAESVDQLRADLQRIRRRLDEIQAAVEADQSRGA